MIIAIGRPQCPGVEGPTVNDFDTAPAAMLASKVSWSSLVKLGFIYTARKQFLPSATKLRRLCFYTCLSFCSQGWGVCLSACWDTTTPPDQADTPSERRWLLLQTVRILLECILVSLIFVTAQSHH